MYLGASVRADMGHLATGAEMRVTGSALVGTVVCVNGGQAREVEGTWSASIEWLVRKLAPRLPELAFAEVRYRVKSWNRLDWCIEDARAAIVESASARTVLLGFSMGGAVAIAAAKEPSVEGVVGLAPWIPERLDLTPIAGKSLVVLHGALDRWLPGIPGVSPGSSRRGFERAQALGISGRYTVISGAVHGLALRSPGGRLFRTPACAPLGGARRGRASEVRRLVIEQRWLLFLVGCAVVASLQGALYWRQRATRNATLVDAGWAFSLAVLAVLYAVLAPGGLEHRILIATLASIESIRIGWLVMGRLGKDEDTRYAELRERWRARGHEQRNFAVFFQAQALVAAILSIPFLLASYSEHDGLQPLEWAGAALWVVAFSGEWLADRQLAAFKAKPAHKGTTLRSGLWRYSRHPNYFFQWLTWVAYALIALPAPYGWLGLIAPVLMLLSIFFVTGIPPAEAQALRSRGDDYRRYQRETSAFIPLPPRRAS